MSKKSETEIEKYLKSIGLNPDKSKTFSGPQTFLRMKDGESVVVKISKVVYDWYDDYNKETKDVRIDFTLLASSDPEHKKYIETEMYWNSKSPESKEFFGTMKNQKPEPKKAVVITRVNYSQWAFSGWD